MDVKELPQSIKKILRQAQPEVLRDSVRSTLKNAHDLVSQSRQRKLDEDWLKRHLGSDFFELLQGARQIYQISLSTIEADIAAAHRLKEIGLISPDQFCFKHEMVEPWIDEARDARADLEKKKWVLDKTTGVLKHDKPGEDGRRTTLLSEVVRKIGELTNGGDRARTRQRIARILKPYFPPNLLDTRQDKPISNALRGRSASSIRKKKGARGKLLKK